MNIRPTNKNDALAIATVSVASWRYAYKGIVADKLLASLDPEKKSKAWLHGYGQAAFDSIVAETDEGVIGFVDFGACRASQQADIAEIVAIYIAPSLIGKGIGSALFDSAIAALVKKGYARCIVWVLEDNALGRHFYERKGFVLEGPAKAIPNTDLMTVRYVKTL